MVEVKFRQEGGVCEIGSSAPDGEMAALAPRIEMAAENQCLDPIFKRLRGVAGEFPRRL